MSSLASKPKTRPMSARGLVVFDLEAVLLAREPADGVRRDTAGPGSPEQRIQLAAARIKEARALRTQAAALAYAGSSPLKLAPGAQRALWRLQQHGIVCAIVSLGWDFVAEGVAARLGVQHCLGSGLERSGAVVHVWPEDRADFAQRIAEQLGLSASRTELVLARTSLLALADRLIRDWT